MQYEYECTKCGCEQVKNVKLADRNKLPKESCESCGAKGKSLKRVLSAHPKHGSWQAKWQG